MIGNNDIILAISNIDKEKRNYEESLIMLETEKLLARTDGLTGALNRYSYNEFENEINDKINKKEMEQFSIIVCDINDLKIINDTLGHEAGDNYIIEAKHILSSLFTCPIYRVGGDEFVIVLQNRDFLQKDYILEKLYDKNLENAINNKVVISFGVSDYNKNIDSSVADVFNRADSLMYENKKMLKIAYKKIGKKF